MIDLHCHLCFGCDDGPRDAVEALALARALASAGVTDVACTPHVRPDKGWWNTSETQAGLHHDLHRVLDEAALPMRWHQGAEHYFDVDVLHPDFAPRLVPYDQTRWLLLELPYLGKPVGVLEALLRLRRRGLRLLLAHVERYPWLCDDDALLHAVMDAGCLLQVNLGSLAGAFDRSHRKAAERLVSTGRASVAASDAHRAGDVVRCLEKGRTALRKLVGDEGVRRLTEVTPRAILDDQPPEALWP
ncbi:MAG: CpsB/CapC family capsule biosynthesis tyrosine phosphatase [Myxococcota bacterium]